jgi:hypothetical protein
MLARYCQKALLLQEKRYVRDAFPVIAHNRSQRFRRREWQDFSRAAMRRSGVSPDVAEGLLAK